MSLGSRRVHRSMMRSLLAIIGVAAGACVAAVPPASKAATTPTPMGARGSGSACSIIECGENGTQVRGLRHGERTGAVHAVTLPSGELVPLP
jgi:hypothetical protein